MIKVGDLVEWGILSINPNDLAAMYQRIKDGKRLENLPVGTLTTIVKHTGMISNINDFGVTIIDFGGKEEVHILIEEAEYILTILNK